MPDQSSVLGKWFCDVPRSRFHSDQLTTEGSNYVKAACASLYYEFKLDGTYFMSVNFVFGTFTFENGVVRTRMSSLAGVPCEHIGPDEELVLSDDGSMLTLTDKAVRVFVRSNADGTRPAGTVAEWRCSLSRQDVADIVMSHLRKDLGRNDIGLDTVLGSSGLSIDRQCLQRCLDAVFAIVNNTPNCLLMYDPMSSVFDCETVSDLVSYFFDNLGSY